MKLLFQTPQETRQLWGLKLPQTQNHEMLPHPVEQSLTQWSIQRPFWSAFRNKFTEHWDTAFGIPLALQFYLGDDVPRGAVTEEFAEWKSLY